MSNGFLEEADFKERLTLQQSADYGPTCFFDLQVHGGTFLGYRTFLNLEDNSFLLAAEEMAVQFSRMEDINIYMKEEEKRVAKLGTLLTGITVPTPTPACQLVLAAGEFVRQNDELYTYNLCSSIQDGLYVIRMVLAFHVNGMTVPTDEITSVFAAAVLKSRSSRRLGY